MPKPDNTKSVRTYPAFVVNTVFVSRPDPSGRKDKDGNPLHLRIEPKVNTVFEFTEAEVREALLSSPGSLRDPKNESQDYVLSVEKAGTEAALRALDTGAAPGDARMVARTAAQGSAKLPGHTSQQGPGDTDTPADDDEDL